MNSIFRDLLCGMCWRAPWSRLFGSRMPTVLMYHGIPRECGQPGVDAATFERHIIFLKEHFEFIAPEDMGRKRGRLARPRILLTFDDGFGNNAEVAAPILRTHGVPAVFFVCSGPARHGRLLWFAYLRVLTRWFQGDSLTCLGRDWDMTPAGRSRTIRALRDHLETLRPHPGAIYRQIEEHLPDPASFAPPEKVADHFAGMTARQVADLSRDPLFTVGAHTVDHPYLSLCDAQECRRQLLDNKTWIEDVTGRPCEVLAYPLGDYDRQVLACCRELGFRIGYAVIPQLRAEPELEIPRMGVYRPSLEILGVKATYGNVMRQMHLGFG